jgi:hypothetical protein
MKNSQTARPRRRRQLERDMEQLHWSFPPKERDFDGYSGAPVYFIFADDAGQAHVGWVGIIRLGGNGILHACLASEIRRSILTSATRTTNV